MQTRRFGRTELQMPLLSCGGMRYQHKWQDVPLAEVPPENQANLEATIRRAFELGINHVETACGYGSSERQLGLVLPQLPRERLIVQTKVHPKADRREFLAQVDESLARLRLDYVDLLGIHGINTHEHLWWATKPGGCLEVARGLVAQGKVRHVGFSAHGPTELIVDAIGHQRDGGFDYVNLHWYFIFQQNWPAIEAARRADMGVFIISPSDKGGMLYKPPAKLVELCRPLHPLVFNALFCLARPEVNTISVGAARPGDFDLQLEAVDLLDRADELLPPIERRLRQALLDAVGPDADRQTDGLPPWHRTPGLINMPMMLWLRQLVLAYDLLDYARMRYNLLGNGGHWFPGLGAGHLNQLDLTKTLANSPHAAEIPDWLRETHALLHRNPERRLSESG